MAVIVDSLAGIVDSKLNAFFFQERENDEGSAGFAVLSKKEYSREN